MVVVGLLNIKQTNDMSHGKNKVGDLECFPS